LDEYLFSTKQAISPPPKSIVDFGGGWEGVRSGDCHFVWLSVQEGFLYGYFAQKYF
jgi:hypothetical protein